MTSPPPARLPRGRHKLSRADVLGSQRIRLVEAIGVCVARLGFQDTTVTDVVSTARVSRNAFYELFADKEACFLSYCDELQQDLLRALYAEAAAPSWRKALESGMTTYLQVWQEQPNFARAYLLELPSAGRRALEQREQTYARFRELFAGLAARARIEEPGLPPIAPLATRLVVVGITEIVAEETLAGRLPSLHELHDELTAFVVNTLTC